jgi:hypothetical protein
VPFYIVERAMHLRVACERCRVITAELCARRQPIETAVARAIAGFKAAGWHVDVRGTRDQGATERNGRWYCPECASHEHL